MATSLAFTNSIDVTDAVEFIPTVWSDDVVAGYKKNLVIGNLMSKINHNGKKGAVINIPSPSRGSANAKAANNVVTLNAFSATGIDVTINKHYEYSFVVEDIAELQALPSLRAFFTDDAGFALATQVDNDCRDLAATWNGGTAYSGAVIGGDGSTAFSASTTGNGTALTDAGIRRVIQTLDDNDVPMKDRYLVIPPVTKRTLLGIARFTEQAFTGESAGANSVRNGLVGDVYGIPVYVSTNCKAIESADSTDYRVCLMFHKSVGVLATQQSVRTQAQYKQEALGTLVTADTVYGVANIRPTTAGLAIVVPS